MGLARHESEFEAAGEATLELKEMLAALGRDGSARTANRRDAIARCLSASKGWRDASATMGGAFASLEATTGLTDDKEK